jgi:hypothetical protein
MPGLARRSSISLGYTTTSAQTAVEAITASARLSAAADLMAFLPVHDPSGS